MNEAAYRFIDVLVHMQYRSRRVVRAVARHASVALLGGLALVATAQAASNDYPQRPIRAIVPTAPGGPVDIVGRLMAQKMGASMGQPIIVENRGGAGGYIGAKVVATAPPDGYVLLSDSGGHISTPIFSPPAPYDAIKDFTPVALVAKNYGQVLVVHPSVPAKSVQELLAYAKKYPGKLTYGANSTGSILAIGAEMMKAASGTDILAVQYQGAGPAMIGLLGGQVDMIFAGTQQALPLIKAGRLRALAITGPKRWAGLPDVPTMQEAGLKDFNLVGYFGLWLPAGASPELVSRLHAETMKALADPDVKVQLDKLGLEASDMTPQGFIKFIQSEDAWMRALQRKLAVNQK